MDGRTHCCKYLTHKYGLFVSQRAASYPARPWGLQKFKKKKLESQFEANLSNLEVRLPFQYLAYSKIPVLFMIQSMNLKSEHWVSQLYEPKVLGVLAAVSVLSINIAI